MDPVGKLREGLEAKRKGEVETARDCFLAAIAGFEKLASSPSAASAPVDAGSAAMDAEAQPARTTIERLGVRKNEVLARVNLGALEHHAGNLDDAEVQFAAALEMARELDDVRRIAVCEGNLAAIYLERGRDDAEAMLRSALAHYREIDEPAGIGNQLGNLGMFHQSRGEYDQAAECLAEAGKMFERAGHVVGAAGTLRVAGELHRRTGNHEMASEAFQRALFLSRQVDDKQGEAYARRAIGQTRMSAGDLDVAVGHFRAALGLHEEIGDVRGLSAAHLDLGQALMSRGETVQGFEHLEKAVELARSRSLNNDALASTLLALGSQRAHTGSPEEGLAAMQEALGIYLDASDPHGSAATYLNRAAVLLLLGRWDEVEGSLVESERLANEAGLVAILPSIAALSAQLAHVRGEFEKALDFVAQAVMGFDAVGKGKLANAARISHALMALDLGQTDGVAAVLEDLAERSAERNDDSARADATQGLARVARLERRHADALELLDDAITYLAPYRNVSALAGLRLQRAVVTMRAERWNLERFERLDQVEADLGAAERLLANLGFEPREVLLDLWRAELLRRHGEFDAALERLTTGRERAEALGFPMALGFAAQIEARIARQERRALDFANAMNRAVEIFEQCGAQTALEELLEDFSGAHG